MCVGPFRPPKLPKLPDPRPTAPAPEQTAKGVVTGRRRKRSQGNVLGLRRGQGGRNTGIDSLRIGLGSGRGDLKY